ncbi:MAG: adenylate kinase family protein [Candidatus Thermoplasmatota archaeon]|nr:adenylate kinase family protein [Candidatus Thermoplasmatota archaeon]
MATYALTGVPGTGKTTVAALLAETFEVLEANELAEELGAIVGEDEERGASIVDEDVLSTEAPHALDGRQVLVEGGLAHFFAPDAVVVLRCHPDALRERLNARDWPEAKVEENVMAETLDAITSEVAAEVAWEIDTTETPPEEVARLTAALFKGETVTHPAVHPLGGVDWTATLMG